MVEMKELKRQNGRQETTDRVRQAGRQRDRQREIWEGSQISWQEK